LLTLLPRVEGQHSGLKFFDHLGLRFSLLFEGLTGLFVIGSDLFDVVARIIELIFGFVFRLWCQDRFGLRLWGDGRELFLRGLSVSEKRTKELDEQLDELHG